MLVVLVQFDNNKYEDADDAEPPMDDKSLLILEAECIFKKATLARRATTVWAFSPGPRRGSNSELSNYDDATFG